MEQVISQRPAEQNEAQARHASLLDEAIRRLQEEQLRFGHGDTQLSPYGGMRRSSQGDSLRQVHQNAPSNEIAWKPRVVVPELSASSCR